MLDKDKVLSEHFAEWINANGILHPHVKPAFVTEGWRGLTASREVQSGALSSNIKLLEENA